MEPGDPPWIVGIALLTEFVAVVGMLGLMAQGNVQDSVGVSAILGILGVTRSLAAKAKAQAAENAAQRSQAATVETPAKPDS